MEVVSTEQKIQVELGSVPFVGVIDRVDRIGADLVVSDYKSGTLPGYRWRHDKIQQVMLYAAALQSHTGRRGRAGPVCSILVSGFSTSG